MKINRMLKLTFVVVLLVLVGLLSGCTNKIDPENAKIMGTVHDNLGNPAEGAVVNLGRWGKGYATTVDSEGNFKMFELAKGQYFLLINGKEYETFEMAQPVVIKEGETLVLEPIILTLKK